MRTETTTITRRKSHGRNEVFKVKRDGQEIARIRKHQDGRCDVEAGEDSVKGLPGFTHATDYCDTWV